jgi:ribonuclease R
LSYNIVREILSGNEGLRVKYEDILPMVGLMDELREILHTKRARRGSIDFDLPEQKVILDDKLKPIEIVQRVHGNAESIIEEFMLAANETVAQHMFKQKWPSVYRVHDLPAEDKMNELAKLLANFNVKFRVSEEMKPAEIQRVIKEIEGRPEERLVSTVALRSMKQAVYQTDNIGHFGLAAEYYTHFTSPIRRYPDLIVHRLLREWMQNPKITSTKAEALTDKLDAIAEHSSLRERAAADAERATVELKKCEYMEAHIGEEFDGVISGVTSYGMFVELPNGVEGLVHISSLVDDYYDFYEERYALVGTHTKNQYRLGDKVRIEVLQVNIQDVSIDFIMAGENAGVREHIRQQLLGRQNKSAAYGQKRAGGTSTGKKDKAKEKVGVSNKTFVASKSKSGKGSKNKEAGRRSAKHGKDKQSKKHRKKR